MLTVRPALPWDAIMIAPRLREADAQEIQAGSGVPIAEALVTGVLNSDSHAALAGDKVVAIGGIAATPANPAIGIAWMVAAQALTDHRFAFLRMSRPWLDTAHGRFPVLKAFADARNMAHVHWLHWCGFRAVQVHHEFGVERRPFIEFNRTRNV